MESRAGRSNEQLQEVILYLPVRSSFLQKHERERLAKREPPTSMLFFVCVFHPSENLVIPELERRTPPLSSFDLDWQFTTVASFPSCCTEWTFFPRSTPRCRTSSPTLFLVFYLSRKETHFFYGESRVPLLERDSL